MGAKPNIYWIFFWRSLQTVPNGDEQKIANPRKNPHANLAPPWLFADRAIPHQRRPEQTTHRVLA
jgi:hypothetical protein